MSNKLEQSKDFNDILVEKGLNETKKILSQSLQQIEDQEVKNKPNLIVKTIKEFLSEELPQKEYIIDKIFPKQGLMMIYAKRGIGKTFFALYLSCKIASGSSLFDNRWKVSKARKILYIDGEMPAITMQERLANIVANFSEDDLSNNLSILTNDLQKNHRLLPDIASIEGQEELKPLIQDHDIIVIDNLSTLCRSGKENESNSWITIQDWVLGLRSQGKSVIFVHHAGKNNDQRGTSKKEDILDTVINLKRPDDYDSKEGARFEVHFEKSRGFAGDDAKPFELNMNFDSGKADFEVKEIEDLQLKRVVELSQMKMTQREIAQEMNISASTVNRLLKKATELL